MIELLKVLVCMPFLLYSCYSDIKTRRVSNRVWPLMLAAGSVFVLYDLFTYGPSYFFRMVLSFVLIFLFVYLLFYLNAFGGADAKVMMVISILIPIFPAIELFEKSFPIWGIPPIDMFAFSVFGNSVILTVIVPLGLFLFNLTHLPLSEILRKPFYTFVGYKCQVSDLKGKHIRLMEVYEENDGVVTSRFSRGGTKIDEDVISRLEGYEKRNLIDSKVWVTPGLPFMIPITAGFITSVVFGDVIFYLTMKYLLMF